MSDTPTFVDAFYADSWVDVPALSNTRLKPRGFRSVGPFASFPEALEWVAKFRPEATHFKMRKLYIRQDLVTFIKSELPPAVGSPNQ